MNSSKDYLGEIKEKIVTLETQLMYEKKLLNKTTDMLTEDKDKWKVEIKEAEAQIQKTQKEIQEKEDWLKNCKKELFALEDAIVKHEQNNAKMEREIQAEKKNQLEIFQAKEQEVGQLQESVEETLEKLKMATSRNEYIRRQHELEVNFAEDTGEKNLKEWLTELSNALSERERELEEKYKELNSKVRFKRKALGKMRDQVTALQLERDDLMKKSQKLKQQIELLQS